MVLASRLVDCGPVRLGPQQDHLVGAWPRGVRARFLNVSIEGFATDRAAGPMLILESANGELTVFHLPPEAGGRIESTLEAGSEAIASISLRPPLGAAHASFERLRLSGRSWTNLVGRVLLSEPEEAFAIGRLYASGLRLRALNRLRRKLALVPAERRCRGDVPGTRREATDRTTSGDRSPDQTPSLGVVVCGALDEAEFSRMQDELTRHGIPRERVFKAGAVTGGEALAPDQVSVEDLVRAVDALPCAWVWLLAANDRLAIDALPRLSQAVAGRSDVMAVYGDDDVQTGTGAHLLSRLKPAWNPALFWAQNYLGAVVFRRAMLAEVLDAMPTGSTSVDEIMIVRHGSLGDEQVVHIPGILVHRAMATRDHERRLDRLAQRGRQLEIVFKRKGADVSVDRSGLCRVEWRLVPPPPRVSVIVPTRDRVDLLSACIDGLRYRTDYPDFEIMIANNESQQAETRDFLGHMAQDPRVTVLDCPGPFNFAAINNRAVGHADAAIVCFVNNDIDVMEPGWLAELVGWASRPNVGAVGAKLFYPAGTLQHAGIVLSARDGALHVGRHRPGNHPGEMDRHNCHQYCSAVTAACLAVEKHKFEEVGGFDDVAFPVAFNDVDLCLKLGARGYKTVWSPHAQLLHKESATRFDNPGRTLQETMAKERSIFVARWEGQLVEDPYFDPEAGA